MREQPLDVSTRETFSLVRRTLQQVWPYRYQVGVKLILSLIGISIVLILPWPLKILIDHVVMSIPVGEAPTVYPPYAQWMLDLMVGRSPMEIVWLIVGMSLVGIVLIGAFGNGAASDSAEGYLAEGLDTATKSENQTNISGSRVSGLLGLFEYRYQLRVTHQINHDLRSLLYDRLMALPMLRFSDASIGDAVYRVMYDTPSVSRVCYDILVTPIVSLYAIGAVIWTTNYSFTAVPSVIAIAWLALPFVLTSTLLMTGITRRRSIASRQAGAETTATVEEGMSNIAAVQSLGANKQQRDAFEKDSAASFRRFRLFEFMNVLLAGLQYAVVIGLVLYVFYDIATAIIEGRMSAGDYAVLYGFFIQIASSASAIGAIWFNLQNSVAGMKRVYDVIDMPVDIQHFGQQVPSEEIRRVTFNNVSFQYPDRTQALTEINLTAEVGEMIALVGATGAGKSTLAYLFPGFIQPTSGRILFNESDQQVLSIEHIRKNVSFVFQESIAFDDTIANNIRMGNPDADDEAMRKAASAAGALSFIENTPNGFDTRVGQSGSMLSVGQKLRISIARGLVSDAPILILDEPTAALDPETENALVSALQTERARRLLVVIAHRLSTIRSADKIVFVDQGRILETGSHDELMAIEDGAYRRFVELQVG